MILLLVQVLSLEGWQGILLALLLISLGYQLVKIFPYTIFSRNQVKTYQGEEDEKTISLLISNVLTPNKKFHKLIQLVKENKPDILLTLESDKQWEKQLKVLEEEYKFSVKVPLDNFYGMHLYSKLELRNTEVMYLIDNEIPSIHGDVVLKSGDRVKVHCLHPMPPSPTESITSTDRDAELLLVGKNIDTDKGPELVFGDLNDVAWSRTTKLFQKLSGLLDPRIGRGFFNTFHAEHILFRWPLDHVFHSNDFTVKLIKRLGNIGSDHFPMFIILHLEARAKQVQEEPDADHEEEEWAEEKIDKANPKKENIG
jgi:endonuclease/exonuclease/phosphatase (EEP) superfamily protein YafD